MNLMASNSHQVGYDAAVAICNKHYYASDKQACLEAIHGKLFDEKGVTICDKHYYPSDKQACLLAIAGLTWSEQNIAICDQHYYASDKQNCLVKTGDAIQDDKLNDVERAEVIQKIESAISHINQGNDAMARRVLFHTIDYLEGRNP